MLLVLLVELLQRGLEQVLAAALLDGLDAGGGRVLVSGVNKISRNSEKALFIDRLLYGA